MKKDVVKITIWIKGVLLMSIILLCSVYKVQHNANQKIICANQLNLGSNNSSSIFLNNNTLDTISFVYFDFFYDLIPIKIYPLHSFVINTKVSLWVMNTHYKHGTVYLINPGDSLLTSYDTGNDIKLSSNNKLREKEVDIFRYINSKFDESYYQIIFNKTLLIDLKEKFAYRDKQLKERLTKSLLFLEQYISENRVSDEIVKVAKNIIRLEYYSKGLLGLWNFKSLKSVATRNKNIFDSMYLSLKNDSLDNSGSPIPYKNVKYSYFVRHVQFEIGQDPFEKSEYQKPAADTLYKFALNEIHNEGQLDYFLFLIVKEELLKFPKSSQKCLQTFFMDCKNELYRNYINEMLLTTKSKSSLDSGDIFVRGDKSETNLSTILNSFKGQIVYLDIWASWCAPCRSEMPAAAKLREKYKNKQIQFLYISIDNNFNLWNKAINQEGLSVFPNSYLLLDFENSDFKKKFRIGPIPRYLIIDKSGNVIISEASRPSEESLTQVLDDLLK